jgi:hypothetical protein
MLANEFLHLLLFMARSVVHEKHDSPRPESLGVLGQVCEVELEFSGPPLA